MRASQESAVEPLRIAQRTAALAPMISSRRRVRSPIRDVLPSFCLPPVERCSGVSPSHAAKSRCDRARRLRGKTFKDLIPAQLLAEKHGS